MENLLKAKDTAFALVLILILVGIFSENQTWFYAAGAVTLAAMLWSLPFVWLSKVWFGLAGVLSYIGSRVLLSVVFFFILAPIALIHRATHKNPLWLKNNQDSLFIKKDCKYEAKNLTSPF